MKSVDFRIFEMKVFDLWILWMKLLILKFSNLIFKLLDGSTSFLKVSPKNLTFSTLIRYFSTPKQFNNFTITRIFETLKKNLACSMKFSIYFLMKLTNFSHSKNVLPCSAEHQKFIGKLDYFKTFLISWNPKKPLKDSNKRQRKLSLKVCPEVSNNIKLPNWLQLDRSYIKSSL